MKRGGFFAGAVGGLAIALLLVGLVSVYPQANPSIPAAPTTTSALATSAACSLCEPVPSQTSASSGAQAQLNNSSNQVAPIATSSTTSQAQQRPDSLLTVLPGESIGSLIATISPLLVAFVIAGLVYGAYVRRQDASS